MKGFPPQNPVVDVSMAARWWPSLIQLVFYLLEYDSRTSGRGRLDMTLRPLSIQQEAGAVGKQTGAGIALNSEETETLELVNKQIKLNSAIIERLIGTVCM